MTLKINRKAALELSTNALVVVIVSMISIALIIVFLNSLSGNVDRLIEDRYHEASKLIEQMSCNNKKVCITPEVLEMQRKTFFGREKMDTVFLIINNIEGVNTDFSINTTVLPLDSECVRTFFLYQDGTKFQIIGGKEAKVPIILLDKEEDIACSVKIDVFLHQPGSMQPLLYDTGMVHIHDR